MWNISMALLLLQSNVLLAVATLLLIGRCRRDLIVSFQRLILPLLFWPFAVPLEQAYETTSQLARQLGSQDVGYVATFPAASDFSRCFVWRET